MDYRNMTKRHHEDVAKELVSDFGNKAYKVALIVRDQIPMYTGNLNPTWEFWNKVARIIGDQPAQFTINESGYKVYPQ